MAKTPRTPRKPTSPPPSTDSAPPAAAAKPARRRPAASAPVPAPELTQPAAPDSASTPSSPAASKPKKKATSAGTTKPPAARTPRAATPDDTRVAEIEAKAAAPVKTKPTAARKTSAPSPAAPPPDQTAEASPAAPTPRKRAPVARKAAAPVVPPPAVVATREASTQGSRSHALRVVMIASEATPLAKTGGLADVVGALPKALASFGHQVTVVIPRYRGIDVEGAQAVHYAVEMGGHHYDVTAHIRPLSDGVRVVLVDHPAFFDRDGIYGVGSHDYEDNARRFAYLTLAALEFARREGQPIDVVHGHDWPAGLAPLYLRSRYEADPVLGRAASVFTIHNVAFKGLFAADWLPQLGLGWEYYAVDHLEYWLHVSLLKGGITGADVITAVSRRYAQEIQTPEVAFGFEGVIRASRDRLIGIRNGIDTDAWNPATDVHLPQPYDASTVGEGKAAAKRALLDALGLPSGEDALARPLLAMISRMVDQKGLDLIADVVHDLAALDVTIVVMGEGEPWYEEMWRSLSRRYPDRIAVRVGFEESLSHLIEAGADVLMMPSRFEPCGLNQMYSMRYGTIPVVRATGGLADTVEDFQPATGAGTGFVFDEASGQALLGTIRRALDVWRHEPEAWRTLQQNGMSRDFSWEASARAYLEAYDQAIGKVPARQAAAAGSTS